MTVRFRDQPRSRETEWKSWWPLTAATRGRGAWARRGGWSWGNNRSKPRGNTRGMRTGTTEDGQSMQIIRWVKTSGGTQWEMEGDRQICGEPEATRRKDSERNAAVSVGNYKIPCFRRNTLLKTEIQWTGGTGVSEHGADKDSNGSCTQT